MVALADDHPVVRAGLRTLLEADDSVRGREESPREARGLCRYLARRALPNPRLASEKTITMMPRMMSFQVARVPSVPPP